MKRAAFTFTAIAIAFASGISMSPSSRVNSENIQYHKYEQSTEALLNKLDEEYNIYDTDGSDEFSNYLEAKAQLNATRQ